jgi:glycosyltransferase involved in cell wall biosynthesis
MLETHLGKHGMTKISIITPCYNEQDNILKCIDAVKAVFDSQMPNLDYEHIIADNASTDKTFELMMQAAENDKHVKLILNSRNVGPFRNMWNAMKSASGDAIIPLVPADLQDPVSVIPKFVEKWQAGSLVVYGVRKQREESILMRTARGIYYSIIKKFAEADIPKDSGEFLLADRRVIDSILDLNDQYPYIRGLVAQTGVKSSFVEYTWVARKHGKSKNNFLALVDQAINGFISTSRMPARIALATGFFLSFCGIVGAILTALLVIFSHSSIQPGIPTIIVSVLFFSGFQLLFLGVIGEYVLSIHGQVRQSPAMFEVQKVNFS